MKMRLLLGGTGLLGIGLGFLLAGISQERATKRGVKMGCVSCSWEDALDSCRALGPDWRLPHVHELQAWFPTDELKGVRIRTDLYWSSEEVDAFGHEGAHAVAVASWDGEASPVEKSGFFPKRGLCIHGVPSPADGAAGDGPVKIR